MKHVIVFCITLVLILVNVSCEQNTASSAKDNKSTETIIKSSQPFWGTWIKMSDGTEYVINETTCSYADKTKNFTEANRRFLTVSGLGTFEKESNAVMVMDNIPYYRKNGADLKYSIKVVGFVDNRANAASSIAQRNKKVRGRSQKYHSYLDETKTDNDGIAHLTAPTANDIQSVTVEDDNGTSVTVNDLKIEHNGANMGTIALVKEGQYSLKITGTIDDKEKIYDDKPNGYLYAHKEYPMKLTITNISKVPATTFLLTVEATHPSVTVAAKDGSNLSGLLVGTLATGGTKSLDLGVICGDIDTGRIDTEIKITITNLLEKTGWDDCVPLRFHRGTQCFTIAALSTDSIEENATLNGFIICPDGNNQFFSVNNYEYETIRVPEFNSDEPYRLVFCGARANSGLGSTEMSYTVVRGEYPLAVEVIDNKNTNYVTFGEPNDTESSAFSVLNYFQAYLDARGDIDYFDMTVDDVELPFVTLDNQGGTPPFYELTNCRSDEYWCNYPLPIKRGWIFDGYWSEPNGGGEQYNDKDGVTVKQVPTLEKKTLYAKWILVSPKIGDIMYSDMSFSASYETDKTPLGVVFDLGDKIKILELQEELCKWCLAKADGYDRDLATSISDGSVNWQTICKTVSDEETAGNYPAFEYASGNGWYMPAKNELNTIYTHKTAINSALAVLSNAGVPVSLLGTGKYWSSTSYSESRFGVKHTTSSIKDAWYQDFSNGTQETYYKVVSFNVRAVKAF